MKLGEYILQYRKEHGISQAAFEKMSGISKGYISMLENDKNPRTGLPITPSIDMYQKAAGAMGLTVSQLFREVDSEVDISESAPNLPPEESIPLLGEIACGRPILAEENITEYIQFPSSLGADFCLRCRGDSMIDARIYDGDIVFIRQQPTVENGEIAAVLIGEETTLKRVYHNGNTLMLMPANPAYEPMVFTGQELSEIRILGKAISYLSYL